MSFATTLPQVLSDIRTMQLDHNRSDQAIASGAAARLCTNPPSPSDDVRISSRSLGTRISRRRLPQRLPARPAPPGCRARGTPIAAPATAPPLRKDDLLGFAAQSLPTSGQVF